MIVPWPFQEEAIQIGVKFFKDRSCKQNGIQVLPTGCHAKGTEILMYNGDFKNVEDVVVGDQLMGDDSTQRTVLNLCCGSEMMYSITPLKGCKPFIVNGGHILHLVCTRERKNIKYASIKQGGEVDDISVYEYLKKSKSWKHLRKISRSKSVIFPVSEEHLPIPAYFLGVLLGDGSTMNGGVSITTADSEIVDEVTKYATEIGLTIRTETKENNLASSLYMIKKDNNRNRMIVNPLSGLLREMGVAGKDSSNKSIPQQYKVSSAENRLEILAGLIDTDGSHDGMGGYDFISKSEHLAKDVCFISRSLGFSAHIRTCTKSCQNNFTGTYYRVCISGNTDIIPCRIKRKKAPKRLQKKNNLLSGFKVEEMGVDRYYGFTLDKNHLYLTSDFVVHHNSGKSVVIAGIAKALGEDVLVFQPSKEILEQNYDKLTAYGFKATIYSASMGQKKISSITFATIGSVTSKMDQFRHFKNIIVDECHGVSSKGGMYHSLIKHIPNCKVMGLTATPYRLATNSFGTELRFLTRTNPRIFSKLLYFKQVGDLFQEGRLSALEYYEIKGFDRSKIRLNSGGSDFDEKSMMRYYQSSGFEEKLVKVVKRLQTINRKNILVFTRGIKEAYNLQRYIMGSVVITGDTPKKEREKILNDFRQGKITVLINVGVLTTGFDYPQLETVVMARPTLSLALWYQIVGRGMRIHPEKKNCWVVDLCDNLRVFGKVEDLRIEMNNSGLPIISSKGRQLTNVLFTRFNEAS